MQESILSMSAIIISVGGAITIISKVLRIAYRVETLEKELLGYKKRIDDMNKDYEQLFNNLNLTLAEINTKLTRVETKLEVIEK